MADVVVRKINFNGAELMAVQTDDGKIHVGVKWICQGLGLNENQQRVERARVQEDIVLAKGGSKKSLLTKGGKQEMLCIELRFLPIWLAKINANILDDPAIQNKLVDYQLNAADVLAEAFIQDRPWEASKTGYKKIENELRRRNANVREANMYYKLAEKYPYNSQYRNMLYAKAVEVLSGERLIPDVIGNLFDE